MGEWDCEKNTDISPDLVSIKSHLMAHWICKDCGLKWKARVAHRSDGHGCSACKKKTQKLLFNIVNKVFPSCNPIFDYKHPKLRFSQTEKQLESGSRGYLMELDIWIPEHSLAIEYQGEQHYHAIPHFGGESALQQNIRRDKEKINACEEKGITLIHVIYDWDRKEESIKELLVNHGIDIYSRS